ncbi:MAG: ABC transporter substrate-binding protein [Fibrobacter sp.]|jgi:peptide/nickel transport system substrate-binding protein|uniref:ABC transporter substrate-binding protein n=1 Tax=Fibrobacter sp. UWP2 TaxID=1896216 RepID=UPI0009208799|nr:ABC transporter substrate-binding protein [Fibrobacter sp. UWP2]MBO7383721.1 ABC transporter substrate-binding protein [Fibrobacter sp.]SHI77111.1 peptide/nickel transport system substrate-binding protein [Fibrobacter sp. UWP2]
MSAINKIFGLLGETGLLIAAASLVACQETKQESAAADASEYPRAETLYIGGFDWAPPSTFNPLDYDPNFPIDGNVRLMYETLVTYNQLDGKLEPMLADSFEQTDSSLVVHLDPRAKWNNGQPVTVDDVLFTFHIDEILPTPRHGNWEYIQSIEAVEGNNIVFHYVKNNKNPLILLNAIAETSILPKAVFEPLVNSAKKGKSYDFNRITAFKNDSVPVVSGPYNLKTFSPDKIVLERDANYWGNVKHGGKLPAPKFIIHSLYNGNNHFNSAMTKGNLDVSSIFLPRIWDKAKDSIRSWSRNEPYHLPGSITTLIIAHQNAPLNDVAFRQAMTYAVNYEKIKTRAISNYTPDIQAGFILPFGSESKFFNKEDADKLELGFDADKAKKILTDAGYTWNDEGRLMDKGGKPVRTITIECPSGWTDWEDAIKVIVASFQEVGIPAEEKFVDYSVWDTDLRKGTFDLAMKTQTAELSAATPWSRFEQIMGTIGGVKAVGEDAFSNQGRFKNENANKLLAKIPTVTDEKELAAAYRDLNKIFMETVPVIPVMYRPTQYYQFSTKHWDNFPTEENPYAPPQHLIVAAGVKALWEIKPAK